MLASLHLIDLDRRAALGVLRTRPRPRPGVRCAATMLTAPLSASLLGHPDLRRVGLLALCDDDKALEAFLSDEPLVGRVAGGWHAQLSAVRVTGDWPGITDQPTHGRVEGPAVVVTLGQLRFGQTPRFLRASARAEGQALAAPGYLWGTALARPPLVATCSLWRDAAALADYAHHPDSGHATAIDGQHSKPFHHRSAFLRFQPRHTSGRLTGRNPLAAELMPSAT